VYLISCFADVVICVYKVKSSFPCANNHPTIKRYGGYGVQLHSLLTSAFDVDEWKASRSSRFTRREKSPGTHCIEGWVGPRTGLDSVAKRKNHCSCRESNPCCQSRSPVTVLRRIILNEDKIYCSLNSEFRVPNPLHCLF
jgi:hypothetical protein